MPQPKKYTRKTPTIIKGPKAISLFIVISLEPSFNDKFFVLANFEIAIRQRLTIAPIQKAYIIAATPPDKPKMRPMATANLASPRPIHAPFEKNQSRKKGVNKIIGARKSQR